MTSTAHEKKHKSIIMSVIFCLLNLCHNLEQYVHWLQWCARFKLRTWQCTYCTILA